MIQEDKGAVAFYDARKGQLIRTFLGHKSYVEDLAFSPDGTRLVTGSYDRTAIVWDANTGEKIIHLTKYSAPVYAVGWSAKGEIIATIAGSNVFLTKFPSDVPFRTIGASDYDTLGNRSNRSNSLPPKITSLLVYLGLLLRTNGENLTTLSSGASRLVWSRLETKYAVSALNWVAPEVRIPRYRFSDRHVSLDRLNGGTIVGRIESDTYVELLLEPAKFERPDSRSRPPGAPALEWIPKDKPLKAAEELQRAERHSVLPALTRLKKEVASLGLDDAGSRTSNPFRSYR